MRVSEGRPPAPPAPCQLPSALPQVLHGYWRVPRTSLPPRDPKHSESQDFLQRVCCQTLPELTQCHSCFHTRPA